ncbi:hypothetical protein FNV43_RR06864 [Rhamnella rubrinervis]|uniref:FLZ-type domain-containing protein n=1 Tax=Rhamnella rubrinervis TaxID=2594499 RepID=A0A8K0HEB5_9ROSA|nr:hypothetical protein FNV43_RR06864 [Rhamnella rubrinervis]
MADSASDSYFHSDTLSLRHLSSSLFSIHDFLVGFGTKGSSDSDSIRSPTSPLDFGVFSNSSNSVGLRSARSLSENGHQYKWQSSKVGLGIVNSLVNDTSSEVLDSPKRKNILFGPQVKANISNSSEHHNDSLDSSLKSKSLPRNYVVSLHCQTKSLRTQLHSKNAVFGNKAEPLQSSPFAVTSSRSLDSTRATSPVGITSNHNLKPKKFCSEATTIISSSSGIQPSSLPIPIESSQGYVGSLSAKEIELSEDYTCIISHGPNPKTIHIFGDCILECRTNELSNFDKKEESGVTLPQVAKDLKGLTPDSSDGVLKFSYTCKKKLEEGKDIYINRNLRGEKAFCCIDCHGEEIFAEEETEKPCDNSAGSSPESSYHEDIFFLGMPAAT